MIKTTKEIWFSYDLDGKNEGYPYKNTLWVSLDEIREKIAKLRSNPANCFHLYAEAVQDIDNEFFPSKVSALPRFPIEEYVGDKIMKTMNMKRGGD